MDSTLSHSASSFSNESYAEKGSHSYFILRHKMSIIFNSGEYLEIGITMILFEPRSIYFSLNL